MGKTNRPKEGETPWYCLNLLKSIENLLTSLVDNTSTPPLEEAVNKIVEPMTMMDEFTLEGNAG